MRGIPFVFSDFRSGVNLEAAPYSLDSGQAREALNVHTSPVGAIKKRYGCPTLGTPAVTLHSLFGANLATDVLIGAGGTKFYKITTGGTVTELTSAAITAGQRWEFIQAPITTEKGPIWMVNGTDTPKYWDGTGSEVKAWEATEGSVPNGKVIAYHENRVYIAKGSTLYWSDVINPLVWASPKGGSTEVDPEDGQEITALGKVGNYLLIFKERKCFVLFDSNTGAYRRISNDMGTVAPRSVVETEIGTFFVTPDNEVCVTDGQTFDTKVSLPINPSLGLMSGSIKRKVCGTHVGDRIYFSYSTEGSINDTIIEYDMLNGSWWLHKIYLTSSTTTGINQFALLDPSDSSTLYGAGAHETTHKVFKMFVKDKYTDTGEQAYVARWISPWHVFTYPHIRKRVREIRVDAKGSYSLYTYRSFSTSSVREDVTNWEIASSSGSFGGEGEFGGEGTFGGEASIVEKRFYTPGVGRAWSLKFESEDNQDLEIYSYTVAINYRKD